MDKGHVKLTKNNGIAEIEFYHPRSNSLPGEILSRLASNIEIAGRDENIKVIKLYSAGEKAFCAGASFDELVSITEFQTGKKFFMGFAKVINAIRKCNKFVVTAVQGKAVGGGVGLIAASDYAIGVKGADLKLSELALGIGPFVVGPAVERKVGTAAFSTMSIDYDWYSADWGLQKGFYTKLVDDHSELHKKVDALCAKLAAGSSNAMLELKSVVWEGTEDWDELLEKRAEISGRLVLSEFTKNYIKEFKAKTKK